MPIIVYTLVKYPSNDFTLVIYSGDIEVGDLRGSSTTWKPDGTLALAMLGGVIDMNNFAAAVERALHQTYFLEGSSKSFHVDFKSYDSMLKTLGIKCVG